MTGRAASIAARLNATAVSRGLSFQYATLLYMHEGFMRRLSASGFKERFILKGGLLLQCLAPTSSRTTKDIDLLGTGIGNNAAALRQVFVTIVVIDEDDSLNFDTETMELEDIAESNEYAGIRLHVTCRLGNIRNRMQVDVGFGDAVTGSPCEIDYPLLVDGRPFSVVSYPLPVVIAEKFEAMVALADANSRMKDYWDVAFILKSFALIDDEIETALHATFKRRGTPMPGEPIVFAPGYETSERMLTLWSAFLRRTRLPSITWRDTLVIIRDRLQPIYSRIRRPL